MSYPTKDIAKIYHEMHGGYSIPYEELPAKFEHRTLLHRLGGQRTNYSCGQSVGMAGMKISEIPFNKNSSAFIDRLNECIPTDKCGIDPHRLAEGVRALGVMCTEYPYATLELLIENLTDNIGYCAIGCQAPWATLEQILDIRAGHYILVGHAEKRKKRFYGWDPGNSHRWWTMRFEHLEKVWFDSFIGQRGAIFSHWMLHMPAST